MDGEIAAALIDRPAVSRLFLGDYFHRKDEEKFADPLRLRVFAVKMARNKGDFYSFKISLRVVSPFSE